VSEVTDNHSPIESEESSLELARMRTDLAAERTDFSLIRTGFTAASFGAGLTQIIGRGVWPPLAVNLLTLLFIVAGATSVQIGLMRLRKRLKEARELRDIDDNVKHFLVLGVWMLQAALLAVVVMVVIHM
jgi:uncharacterized membrane protein YidH (DUF202 family)